MREYILGWQAHQLVLCRSVYFCEVSCLVTLMEFGCFQIMTYRYEFVDAFFAREGS